MFKQAVVSMYVFTLFSSGYVSVSTYMHGPVFIAVPATFILTNFWVAEGIQARHSLCCTIGTARELSLETVIVNMERE
jgi:hypothetical protein